MPIDATRRAAPRHPWSIRTNNAPCERSATLDFASRRGEFSAVRAARTIAIGTALAAALALAAPAGAAAIDVTTTGDPGPGGTVSLRQAIAASAPGGTIALPAGSYVLAGGPLAIGKSLTISGAGAASTTVSGGGAGRVFTLAGAGAVELSDLTITGGRVQVAGGVQNAAACSPTRTARSRCATRASPATRSTSAGRPDRAASRPAAGSPRGRI